MSFPLIHLVPLAVALLVAVSWDVAARRIPNVVWGGIAAAGLVVQVHDAGALAALAALGAAVGTVAAMYVFWMRGGIGGGDVKLAAAVAIWVGPAQLPIYWLATALAGGGVAAVCLMASHRRVRREIGLNLKLAVLHQSMPDVAPGRPEESGKAGRSRSSPRPERVSVPYGLAIAIGALFVWWYSRR